MSKIWTHALFWSAIRESYKFLGAVKFETSFRFIVHAQILSLDSHNVTVKSFGLLRFHNGG